jgi:replicative DNA helicase
MLSGRRGRGRQSPYIHLGELFNQPPPQALEAEMSVLGSMILDFRVIPDVLPHLRSERDFYKEAHGHVFRALVDLYDQRNSGDLIQLVDLLRDRGVLESIGGPEYLEELAAAVPAPTNAAYFAKIVAEKAKLRRLIEASGQIIYDAYHAGEMGPDGAREVLDTAEMKVFEIAQESAAGDPQKLSELLQLEMDRIEASDFGEGGFTGVTSGYFELDELLRGFQAGELIIIAARPSMGKTALALNLAEQMALGGHGAGTVGKQSPVGLFSLEMSKSAIVQRLLSARSGVSSQALRGGHRIPDRDFRDLMLAAGELKEAPILIDDTPDLTVLNLRARARRMVQQHGVRAIMIDYLQLMSAPGAARESRQVEVSAISRGVKALARELNIPVICLSQLNRGSEMREGNRPRMSDLRESGSIEQDADVVILLHREEYYHVQEEDWKDKNPDKVGVAELIVAKQRNGPTGVVKLFWETKSTRFKNYDAHAQAHGSHVQIPEHRPSKPGYASPSQAAQDFGVPWTQQSSAAAQPTETHSPITDPPADSPFHVGIDNAPWEAEPKPAPPPAGSSFANRPKTGPAKDHRDGGGSDQRPNMDDVFERDEQD